MSRRMFNLFQQDVFNLPALNGVVDVWLDVNDLDSCLPFSSGAFVSRIKNKAGDSSKDFIQSTASYQGERLSNQLNGKAAIVNTLGYASGTTSSYKYMHDGSMAYAIFDVLSIAITSASAVINHTTNGGVTNGFFLFPSGTNGLQKTIRQASEDHTAFVNVVNCVSINGIWSLNNYLMIADVFYGYQVVGNDYELSINGDAPAGVQAQAATASFPSNDHNYSLSFGLSGSGRYNLSEKIIVKWPSQTRGQIEEDVTNIKNYIRAKYALW